jgi:hypothetical protein
VSDREFEVGSSLSAEPRAQVEEGLPAPDPSLALGEAAVFIEGHHHGNRLAAGLDDLWRPLRTPQEAR